jgi:DNA-binding CsgD family transcriptional regulator
LLASPRDISPALVGVIFHPDAAIYRVRDSAVARRMISAERWDAVILDGRWRCALGEAVTMLAAALARPRVFVMVEASGVEGQVEQDQLVEVSLPSAAELRRTTPWASCARSTLVEAFAARHGLSQREGEVLDLAATGLSTKEIASRLDCSQQTIAVYWSRIYRKVRRRSHAEVMASLLAAALR